MKRLGINQNAILAYLLLVFLFLVGCSEKESTPAGPLLSNPINLQSVVLSQSEIYLTWEIEEAFAVRTQIDRSKGNMESWDSLTTLREESFYWTDENLEEGTTYYYRIKSIIGSLESEYSDLTSASTFPSPPTSLASSWVTEGTILIKWEDHSLVEDGFLVEISRFDENGYESTGRVSADTTQIFVSALDKDSTYFFRVRAEKDEQFSIWSESLQSLPAPHNIATSILEGSYLDLTWDYSGPALRGFKIFRRREGMDNWELIAETPSHTRFFTDSGLEDGNIYQYRVKCYSLTSESYYSDVVSSTTDLKPPTELMAERLSRSSIGLTWFDNSNFEDGYRIQRSLRPETEFETVAEVEENIHNYSDNGLNRSRTYYYRVCAFRGVLTSEWSGTADAYTLDFTPRPPGNLGAEVISSYEVLLNWWDHSEDEEGFIVEHSQDDEEWSIADSVGSNDQLHLVDGLQSNTEYFFRVYAYNDSGPSLPSNTVNVVTPLNIPPPPSDVSALADNYRYVELTWRDNAIDENGFILERRVNQSPEWLSLDTLGTDEIEYHDRAVNPLSSFIYRICTFNNSGNSDFVESNLVVVPEGPLEGPEDLTATALNASQIQVEWTDQSDEEQGFRIVRRREGEESFRVIGEVDTSFYLDEGLDAGTWYFYKVKAYMYDQGNVLESAYSNVDSTRTADD